MRMMLASGNIVRKVLLVGALGFFLAFASVAGSQAPTHVVEKGDTLWGICEKYYGDPELWPKLWEMNPFVTNPHLLKPGDVIQLMEKPVAAKPAPAVEERPKPVQVAEESKPKPSGLDLQGMTVPDAAGYLSLEEPQPVGRVFATDSQKLMLSKGDALYLEFGENEGVKNGDVLSICRFSKRVDHPFTGRGMGYLVSPRAKVVLKERSKTRRNMFRAEILEQYRDSIVGDSAFPSNSSSAACLKPLPVERELRGVIAAMPDQQLNAGRYSIVYLDAGSDMGLRPGHLLEIVRIRHVSDPAFSSPILGNALLDLFKVKTFTEVWEKLSRESVLYELVVGNMMVLQVTRGTATALILNCRQNIPRGAVFRGIPWTDRPGFLSSIPSCEAN
ncbi:MAG: LysM domain-containing protein [Thermodesulfobacteriota bacterium]